jgi:hypothetical protein
MHVWSVGLNLGVRRITLAFLVLIALQGVASAHSVGITATASCNGGPVISYIATSDGFDANPVTISFNNVQVDSGVFNAADSFTLSGSKPAPGTGSVSVSATAVWTDGFPKGTASVLVDVPTNCTTLTGRFTGGGKQIDLNSGVTITKGFEVDCDLQKPNNLELNWAPANNFHMNLLTKATCSDDPSIDQKPPSAPIDTFIGEGFGKFNGIDGYKVNFTLIDAGEPGTNDMGAFKVTAPDGTVVLDFPLVPLTGGNFQAHVDQH